MAKMSGQGVRTHHRRAAKRGLWQAGRMSSKACSLQSMIWTAYPDKICYHPGCDVHKCLVLLPDGVALDRGARRASSWGIRMELLRIGERAVCLLGESGWSCSGQRYALRVIRGRGPYTLHTQAIPLAMFHLLRNSIRPTFHLLWISHIRRLMLDGRGGRFNFFGQTCPDPLTALTRRVFLSVYSVVVFS